MPSILLLLGVGVWFWWIFIGEEKNHTTAQQTKARRRAVQRQRIVQMQPDSPAAHESLGDAWREAGAYRDAIASYEQAVRLIEQSVASGAGYFAGGGLEMKIRLTRLEAQQETDRAAHGMTMATRQQICRTCGHLSPTGQERNCPACNTPLPVDTMLDTWRNTEMKSGILQETANAVAMWLIVLLALNIASWMPIEIKGLLFISTTLVLGVFFIRRIGNPRRG